jgi:glycosyltransferase involved in cell wall biosynthesis
MVDAALCVSAEMEEYAKNYLGINNTIIVPNGSDPEMFKPERINPDMHDEQEFKVIWSGSIEYAWQGYYIVEELAKKLNEIDKKILLLLTAEGKSDHNILYLGRVSYQAIPAYIASADVGLCIYNKIDFYSKFYFSPLKLFDYMASGLPIIGSDAGQIKLVIEENKNGLLTNGSIDDIAEKIIYLKNNKAVVSEMGVRSREAVEKKYNWERVALEIEDFLYEQIQGKKSKTTRNRINGTGLWYNTKMIIKKYINR